MAEILGFTVSASIQELVVFAIILALFLIALRKAIRVLFSLLWISALSALFPFAMQFLGFNVSTDLNSIIFFVTLGVGLYVIYIIGKVVYAFLGLAEKAGKAATYPLRNAKKQKDEKKIKKMEEMLKRDKEREEG
jgi:Cu/Ag efflux pump CusA